MAECKAPVFKKNNVLVCAILTVVYTILIALLAFFFWIPGVYCLIKQYNFRIKNCMKGNSDPNINL